MDMDHYTARVLARTEIAQMWKASPHAAAATEAGLKPADLDALVRHGSAARDNDRIQREQLATVAAERKGRKVSADDLFEREDQLRDRLPAVIDDLREAGQGSLADWLTALSFARFRFRELTPPAGVATDAEVRKVERVEREDIPTRAEKLAAFCTAIRAPGREPIVGALEARALAPAFVADLGEDADVLARAGRNVLRAAEAPRGGRRRRQGAAREVDPGAPHGPQGRAEPPGPALEARGVLA